MNLDINKALEILENNRQAEENSFLDYLHEQSMFDVSAYQEYMECLQALMQDPKTRQCKEIRGKVIDIHAYILLLFICHFDKADRYVMQQIPDNYMEYIEQLDDVYKAFLKGS